MLIYVNQFELIHNNDCDIIFEMISQWLNKIIEKKVIIDDLKKENTFIINEYKVNTYVTQGDSILHSILLKHPDIKIQGREWFTEITISIGEKTSKVSILLKTADQSTRVKQTPTTTRPTLIKDLIEHSSLSKSTLGLKVREFSNHSADFEKINRIIEDKERDYPIILISNLDSENKPLVSPPKLQEKLIGLAQVFYSPDIINHYKLANYLTRQYSAWNGAINIIYPSYQNEDCANKLLHQADIEDWKMGQLNVIHEIFSEVTHITNKHKQQQHINQSKIRIKSLSDELSNDIKYQNLIEDDLENKRLKIKDLSDKYTAIKKELEQTKQDKEFFEMRFHELQNNTINKGKPLIVYGDEHDLYQSEINDFILEIIKQAFKNTKEYSRKYDILTDVLKYNKTNNTKSKFIEHCKAVFTNYHSITPKIKEVLRKLNLEIKTEGVHHHMQFINDKRYKMTFSKSPSDGRRTGSNIISQMKSVFF